MRNLFLVCLAGATLASGQQSAAKLVGRWRSVETSKGGIGAMYQFRADGTIEVSPGAVVEMPYRVEADQLILPPATQTGPEQRSAIVFLGDDQLRLTADGGADQYRRQGSPPDPQNRLIGEWLGSREIDGHRMVERMIFYPAGKSLLLIAFGTQTGRYSVANGRLVAEFGGQTSFEGAFDITNDVLSIHGSRGGTTKLSRY